jgi:hypothetical protein
VNDLSPADWQRLDDVIHRDPGGRGLASYRVHGAPLDAGQLRQAATSLARSAGGVAIVTGFCVVLDDRVTAETDGPPGALFLAKALTSLGVEVALISDAYGVPLLEAGYDALGLPHGIVHRMPFEEGTCDVPAKATNAPGSSHATDAWIDEFLTSDIGRRLTHLIAIERCGPSHTLASLAAQDRAGPPPIALFEREVPPDHRDLCHNMRGMSIQGHTAKAHRLFEIIGERQLPIATIGIGDGGNEIGMGSFAWEQLYPAIARGPAARIACRIAVDFPLIAGVSNWGGYALAAAVCTLHGQTDLLDGWANREQALVRTLVRDAGAVDGVTRRAEATVDGLDPGVHRAVIEGIVATVAIQNNQDVSRGVGPA